MRVFGKVSFRRAYRCVQVWVMRVFGEVSFINGGLT